MILYGRQIYITVGINVSKLHNTYLTKYIICYIVKLYFVRYFALVEKFKMLILLRIKTQIEVAKSMGRSRGFHQVPGHPSLFHPDLFSTHQNELSRHREVAPSSTCPSDEEMYNIQTRDIATSTVISLRVAPICSTHPAWSS